LVAGLGNPGPEYAANRHNVGFMVVDRLAESAGAGFVSRAHGRALAAAVRLGVTPGGAPGPKAVLAKPLAYMNLSGGPISELVMYFGIGPGRVIVVHDDLDLPRWEVRIKQGGGSGGHNGLKDITKALGTPDYTRVRCGIGRPPGQLDAATYVLRNFPSALSVDVEAMVERAAAAVTTIVTEGVGPAQLQFHSRPRNRGELEGG
jgi:PTH1 family peptidyl-tRNA hydrolase